MLGTGLAPILRHSPARWQPPPHMRRSIVNLQRLQFAQCGGPLNFGNRLAAAIRFWWPYDRCGRGQPLGASLAGGQLHLPKLTVNESGHLNSSEQDAV